MWITASDLEYGKNWENEKNKKEVVCIKNTYILSSP